MKREEAAAWTCPSCRRTVPGRVEACYCGTSRDIAERMKARESRARPGGPPWAAIGLVLAAAAVVALGFLRSDAPSRPKPTRTVTTLPRPSVPASRRTPSTPRPRERPRREPLAALPTPTAEPVPAATPVGAAEPILEAPPEPPPELPPDPDSMELRRAEGRAELAAALSALEPELDLIRRKVRVYEDGCRTQSDVVQPRGCGILEIEIRQLLDDVDRSVTAAQEEARRSWVQPGTQRDILRERQLDSASRRRRRRGIESALH